MSVSILEGLAEKVEDTGGVYFVPAFSGLLAPHWETDARGYVSLFLLIFLVLRS